MNTSTSALMKKGILKSSGEINKDKINLVAGAVTQPFAEMVWVTTGGDIGVMRYQPLSGSSSVTLNYRTCVFTI